MLDNADSSQQTGNEILGHNLFESAGSDTHQEDHGKGTGEQPGLADTSDESSTPPAGPEPQSGKSPLSLNVLSSGKTTVKLFESILGFDDVCAKQREVVRGLVKQQSAALEDKLQGRKAGEGEDFDSISKQLRKENNRLDSYLEGKESLYTKTRAAAEEGIKALNLIVEQVKQLEDES